ncbi:hypothetical protein HUN01_19265 [Nostoc edaphicum CCNP1411]|uniref:Uncharacterized protein n=1 Tax=Nostoc edaphicum CCNP1411 TaxID=1472755 RepID=A0A7D7LC03_9NOSO|nr:hypothetical protein [Nostoc edaphicum]QMS89613.1 hypothetical protein HUN01_19265 [Nostoc edaphicum CCNP1411]
MKVVFSTLSIVSIIATTITVENIWVASATPQIAQTQRSTINSLIPLALPTSADVWFKDGKSITGQLTDFNSQNQKIQIFRAGTPRSVQLSQVQRISFRRDALVYLGGEGRVIRGEDRTKATQNIWGNIPIDAFRLIDSKQGQASVDLSKVMNQKQLRGILGVAQDSLYVVDEMEFQPGKKLTIKVTPTDRLQAR